MGKAARFLLLLAGRIKPLLDQFSGAAAAYSLRSLSASTTNVVKVRRDSDGAELDFTASDISNGTLASWVNTDVQVMTNPDITSATGWTIGSFTTYNAFTEAFDLLNENGNTVRQSKAIAGLTYDITLVIDSFSSGGIKVYVGGTQSATISSAGTYNLTITAGSSNTILGLNPAPTASCSISSFYATQTISNGFVTTWYDQSGNGYNATQATAASQPKIVSSGSLVTENGKAALDFDGTDDHLANTTLTVAGGDDSPLTSLAVATSDDYTLNQRIYGFGRSTSQYPFHDLQIDTENIYYRKRSDNQVSKLPSGSTTLIDNTQYLFSAYNDGTTFDLYLDGSAEISGGDIDVPIMTIDQFSIGALKFGASTAGYMNGTIQELIFYPSDQSAKRTGIEANINDYYNIYP